MNISDDTFQISTPENVDFGYEIAGIGSRFLAALLDTLLITLLQAAALLAVVFGLAVLDLGLDLNDEAALGWILAIYGLVSFGFLWGYYIFFETLWDGQTPGKRRARLRVIRSDGLPVGFAEAAIRNLVRLVDFLPAYYGVGVVVMFIDGRARRLGDLAAGTLVVRDRGTITLESLEKEREALLGVATARSPAAGTGGPGEAEPPPVAGTGGPGEAEPPPVAGTGGPGEAEPPPAAGTGGPGEAEPPPAAGTGGPGEAEPPPAAGTGGPEKTDMPPSAMAATEAEAPGWPVRRLTAQDLRLAEDFLQRRGELVNRTALARQIARRMQERMGLPAGEMEGLDPENFLRQVLRMRQER